MARQKGPMKYVGTIGDIRHFKIKGNKGFFAGMVGGPTGEQIATAPEFARTRENMNEFGGCATTGKSFRNSIGGLVKSLGDSRVTGRITAIMKKINLEDGSEARGKRAILISQAPQYLKGFEFNKFTPFNSTVRFPYTVTAAADRLSIDITADAFLPQSSMTIPNGASHFRIVNAITVLSDFEFNDNSGIYQPKEVELNNVVVIENMAYNSVGSQVAAISQTISLPAGITLTADVSLVHVMGVEFYQEVNGNYYLLSQGNAMKVNQIF